MDTQSRHERGASGPIISVEKNDSTVNMGVNCVSSHHSMSHYQSKRSRGNLSF